MNKMPHIQLDSSIQATAAILPGDPARVDSIAAFLDNVKEEGSSREYKSITGTYKGRRILAISTGMGGASTAICVEELADLGVTDMIRIGSCGALQSHLSLGQLVICNSAVCDDGTSQTYSGYLRYAADELAHTPEQPATFSSDGISIQSLAFSSTNTLMQPSFLSSTDTLIQTPELSSDDMSIQPSDSTDSISDYSTYQKVHTNGIQFVYPDATLTALCADTANALAFPYVVGPTRCHDALYQREKPALDEFYSQKGIFASDMETAALFAVGALRGIRTVSILNTVVEWKKDLKEGISSYKNGEDAAATGERNEILLALETLAKA